VRLQARLAVYRDLLASFSNIAVRSLLLDRGRGQDLLNVLVAELEVILDVRRVLDLDPDDGRGNHKRCGTDTPLDRKSMC